MKQLTCEMCGSIDLIKKDGVFVCQTCGCKYSVEEARKMMIEGTVSIDGVVKTRNDDFEVRAGELIAYHGAETDVIIPDGIKIIGKKCFAGMQGIESVIIPEGVYKIEIGAFSQCSRLKKIELPKSLVEIEREAFMNCTALATVELPYGTERVGGEPYPNAIGFGGCFSGCTALESINLPDSIQTLGSDCFLNCTALESINLPDSIRRIGSDCFSGCISLESIRLPDSIQMLSYRCFKGCTSLNSIHLPDGVDSLGEECFRSCASLEFVHIPDSIRSIRNHAFSDTPELKTVELPASYIESIAADSFGMIAAQYVDSIGDINSPWFKEKLVELVEIERKERERKEREKNKGCYIATAVYGSYDCPQVWTLRRYRDDTLAEIWYGRAFIRVYYAISPALVKWFGGTKWFKKFCKGKLDRMIANLNAEGVEDTPYEDKSW